MPALKFLIVEDEALLAMDMEAMIEDAGYEVAGECASLREVQALPRDLAPDVAFVDLHLAENSSGLDVCTHIRSIWPDTMVVFVTGNPRKLPEDFAGGHGVLPKPFVRHDVFRIMQYLQEGMSNPPPHCKPPASFHASPGLAFAWA
ncbi:MAG: response regulator [Aurantimonas sp.]|uniref:response regulator n=1 Tax=Aurantimonas TaxID=182269 RepID=UPI000C57AE7A|nr:response regulator [Aurantimonas coralicida]MAY30078.1 response regulator [Aurantimonas sp.]MCD1643692.1 response regulator [Aurantimonas coralicida]MCW7543037.1 response regulator [Aurantimonas litoralis]MDE0921470.1 response regulator [Aurantimonas coralicida]|tara:strand:+ start:652 stop:1089 length:438 start_codon:yes stop_codon:yes gene_type:complete